MNKHPAVSLQGRNPFATQAKLLFHPERLSEWRQRGDTFPILIEINVTNYCNEACRWCISSYSHVSNAGMSPIDRARRLGKLKEQPAMDRHPERRRGLDIGRLKEFLQEAKDCGLKSVTWSGGGEPSVYHHILEAVRYAAEIGLEQGMMTNGFFPEGHCEVFGRQLRWLRVSLDTLDEQKYAHHKQTPGFPRVIANIRKLVEHPAKLGINMNLAQWNEDEIAALANWSRDVGADYFQVRPTLGLPFEMQDNTPYRSQATPEWIQRIRPQLIEIGKLSTDRFKVLVSWDKFEDVADVSGNFGRFYSKCQYHFFNCVLNANGDMAVCMYHLDDSRFTFGNIYENSVKEIWGSEQRQKVIQMCRSGLDMSTCQVCCKGHEINKLLHVLETGLESFDVNFL